MPTRDTDDPGHTGAPNVASTVDAPNVASTANAPDVGSTANAASMANVASTADVASAANVPNVANVASTADVASAANVASTAVVASTLDVASAANASNAPNPDDGPRELPQLAPAEVVAVLVIAVLPLGDTFPYAALLLVVATASMLARRRSWRELVATGGAMRALGLGVAAGAVAVAVATPAIGAFQVTALDWWVRPALQGDAARIASACGVLLATAIAMELALRGWIIVRMLELSPGPPGLPVAVAALAEAFVTPGPLASRLGVALFSAGLGILFIGCGRNVLAPIAARCTFVIGSVIATVAFSS